MQLHFYKYQGTGNDFIMIDGRQAIGVELNQHQIEKLCHRRFGVGADGLIILQHREGYDFEMVYFNSDGRQSSMCGNGGRCIAQFAADLGIQKDEYLFKAIDGDHRAKVEASAVSLQMGNVSEIADLESSSYFLDTGSPHHVVLTEALPGSNFVQVAREIRNSNAYKQEGVNVNFVKNTDGILQMRTFERGVEDETYSCGTGVTAAALAAYHSGLLVENTIPVKTRGGNLKVSFQNDNAGFKNIWLTGPAANVFKGEIDL